MITSGVKGFALVSMFSRLNKWISIMKFGFVTYIVLTEPALPAGFSSVTSGLKSIGSARCSGLIKYLI